MAREAMKLVANNKKAYHDYFIEEKYECGIELFGTEVKSIRMGKCSIKEAYVSIDHGEAFIEGMNISPYEKGNIFNREPLRKRRLLLHKREILKLAGQVQAKGYTLMPLQVYFKNGRVKIEIGLARGKKLYDKRQDIRKKDMKREMERDYKVSVR
ncbi:MAG: SsrA-binding protein SmpB [Lachnospiraceae bacterium]|jgi:SsrA-binding protein|nr:SsrA-binding protein SmpB [Lachnospiraceae bacterium]